ncbi:hypothetical protein J4Q44_G00362690 [Coregonus suidteri]|uniref:Death domain-containing protein n=1 Tax=Coregonus suidteri TaxID=861788 RepID=A0AAN8QEW9_9TELE
MTSPPEHQTPSWASCPSSPSPIPEVSEDSSEDEQGQDLSFKDFPQRDLMSQQLTLRMETTRAGQTPKDKEVQPPSPVPPGADNSDSSDDESVFQPLSFKKYTFKISEGQEQEDKSGSKSPKQDKNRNNKEPGTNELMEVMEFTKLVKHSGVRTLNRMETTRSITDCSIASTPEFSHDPDATEIDSLDGYDMQDEDDGLCEMDNTKPFSLPDSRKDVWASDSMLRSCDQRSFSQTKPRGPQSPCERTDLRTAIVADHLGLSWTELAREMDFSVDEINHIRVDNPNSLTTQSFMLLKKWVSRDGKNATTDSLTEVLTKINRMDIVKLLEGPIFDYGNISGTRCFADDNAVFLDQCDGSSNIQRELQTPTGLSYQPPTPLCSDYFFGEDAGLDSPSRTPTRPCDLSLTQTTSNLGPAPNAQPPTMVVEEDTSGPLDSRGAGEGAGEGAGGGGSPEGASTEDDTGVSRESVASHEPHDREAGVREEAEQDVDMGMLIHQIDLPQGVVREDEWLAGATGDPPETLSSRPALGGEGLSTGGEGLSTGGEGGGSGSPEEEMSEEKLKSLLEEMALEEGSEDEEMTEDRINAILSQVQQADKDVMSSPAGWHSETSSVNVEPPTPGRGLSAEGIDCQDTR